LEPAANAEPPADAGAVAQEVDSERQPAIAAAPRAVAEENVQPMHTHFDRKTAQMLSKYDGKQDIESWISSMRSYFE
jgi:hypothetical protein